ncbi:hypothetical protein [Natrinema marinum]|uniref:hypothetical protein n=1 Tax=Natrinema marinum TaxID=2961598 RepID=UPI0020C92768|nr:hypothetical protein [Natrinema marinum]
MRLARLAALALCCSLVALAAVTAIAAAPPPAPVCGVCGSSVETVNISGADGPGTLDIYVDETGDSLWHARVPVNVSAAERYRTNESALEAAVDRAWPRYHVADGDVRTVETTLENETVVVNYTVDDVARQGLGESWLVDYFHEKGPTTNYDQQACRVTIHTPDGTVVTNRPADASVTGNAATWTTGGADSSERDFDEAVYVTYGEDGLLGTLRGHATIAREVGPTALEHGVRGGVVPGMLLGLVAIGMGRTDWGSAQFDGPTLERLIVAVGSVGAVGFLIAGAVANLPGLAPGAVALAALGVGYALLGSTARRFGDRLETRGLIGLSAVATLAAAAVSLMLAGPPVYAFPLCFGLATALCLPIGHAAERGRVPIALVAVAALAPIAALTAVAPLSVFWYGPVLYGLLLLPWVAVVAVFGYPLALLGRTLALENR